MAVAGVAAAQAESDAATADAEEAERERKGVRTEQSDEPALGTRFTSALVPLVVLPLFLYTEIKLTAPSLRAALETDTASGSPPSSARCP